MRPTFLAAVLLACSTTTLRAVPGGAEKIVWQIGRPDQNYAEFACAGDHVAYARKFGNKPVVFEAGRSEAARDWPFIQPGPLDTWAPARGQPRTIRFTLPEEPQGRFTLRIELVDVQQAHPPRLGVTLNGRTSAFQLAPGGGDGALTDAKLGKPQKLEIALPAGLLKQGVNEIRLACLEGSWVLYDAITLAVDPQGAMLPAEVQSVTARPTPFFIRRDGQVERALEVSVGLSAPSSGLSISVEALGQKRVLPAGEVPPFGPLETEIGVPDSTDPVDVKITAAIGDRAKFASVRVMPQRKWRVYVAPSAHTDVGYTDLQPNCAERHCRNLDTAIDLIKRFPDFRWNTEVAWQAENYVRSRSGRRLADFYRLAGEGKIGIQALYCNVLTGLCSHEEACRLTAFARRLCRQHDIPYRSAMISDVPSQEASLPMILASAGIRYFSSGINNDRAYPFNVMQSRCPCWWEGPDGSRVLMMYMYGYAQASGWGLDESVAAARPRVLDMLAQYEKRADYPYDAVFLHGAVSDNCELNPKLAEVVAAWNARYEFPKIILSHNAEFFEYVEKRYGEKLPVYRGSAGTYWEDGAASSAHETRLNRNAHEALAAGEKFLALAGRIQPAKAYRPDALYEVWRNCTLYDEHTWGAYCSISEPEKDFTKAQWKIKAQFAVDAVKGAEQALKDGTVALAGLIKTDGPALVVFNPSSWTRTDVLMAELPPGLGVDPAEAATDPSRPHALMLAKDVPACGYRVLRLVPEGKTTRLVGTEGQTIENAFYRVQVDPATGGVASILDKETGRELVDAKAPYRLNQYVYAAGGNSSRIVMNPAGPEPRLTLTGSGKATVHRVRSPGVGESLSVATSGVMAPRISTTIALREGVKRIDFFNWLTKTPTYDKEAVYFAFPFAASQPTFRYEVPCGIVNANRDMLPGACLEWFTVQHFVEVSDPSGAIAWATPDAPLVCFQDVNRGKWPTKLPLVTGHLYSYAMNNYWHTNYKAGQNGEHTFRFSITSRAKADNVASARFGEEVASPLTAVIVKANPHGPLPAGPTSLLSVAEPNVFILGTKLADQGTGLIVRLWELAGQQTDAHLRLAPELGGQRAEACNLVEDPGWPLEVRDGVVIVPLRGRGLATVRIQ
jgi:hypothetical protein